MTSLNLLSGYDMPILGLGTLQCPPGVVDATVKNAVECGYRHFDCAFLYQNEDEIGVALKKCFEMGMVKREDVFVTSKVWLGMMRPDLVRDAFQTSLDKLRLDYLDLYLIHAPTALKEGGDLFPKDENGEMILSDVDYLDTYKEMEKLVDAGLARSIGLSNFNRRQIQRVWDNCRIKPSVLQIEIHPYCKNLKLVEFAKSLGIQVTAYRPLGYAGPDPKTPEKPSLLNDPVVTKIAARTGKSPAQILIRYCIDRGISVIPKSSTPYRIVENFQVFDFQLTNDDIEALNTIPTTVRYVVLSWLAKHQHYPFNDEY